MQKTFLVTGGAGFLGSSLVRRLLQAGARVRVLDNCSRGDVRRLADVAQDFEFVRADVRDAAAVHAACRGVDHVCHLACVNGTANFYRYPELVLDIAVKGMLNVLEGCRAAGTRELLLVSSSEVYQTPPRIPTDETAPLSIPDPLNPRYSYAGAKLISELMAFNYGRTGFDRVLVVRPHNVYGPAMGWDHVIPQFVGRMKKLAQAGAGRVRFPIQGTGEETRAFVFVDDFTTALVAVIERGQHLNVYHLGANEEVTIAELARQIGRFYGREVTVEPGELTRGSTPRRCPDIAKVAALGYQPRYRLQDGLPITAKWYDEHPSPDEETAP